MAYPNVSEQTYSLRCARETTTKLSSQLAEVTKELAEAKELMRELKKTLTEEYDGTFTLLDRVKAGMLHANYLARKALKFEGEPETEDASDD